MISCFEEIKLKMLKIIEPKYEIYNSILKQQLCHRTKLALFVSRSLAMREPNKRVRSSLRISQQNKDQRPPKPTYGGELRKVMKHSQTWEDIKLLTKP